MSAPATPTVSATTVPATAPPVPRVRRGRRVNLWTTLGLGVIVVVLAYAPYIFYTSITDDLVTFFILLTMASMWNLLAGYAGLVSIGQQAYIGLGAYGVLQLSDWGVQPYVGVFVAAIACAVIALPTSLLAFRLRGDYFAVGTWVIAEVYHLLVERDESLGGGSGRSLTTLSNFNLNVREALTYWVALGVTVLTLAACYLLLRSRLGLALTAIRDDERAAGSVGVTVSLAKRLVYLVSAAGCGAAGGLLIVSSLNVQPDAIFSVQWSAYMIFIVVIGGIGYLEGPILGAILFFALQQSLSSYGVWYLILIGVIAMGSVVWVPRGLWGLVAARTDVRLFPVGYVVHVPTLRERAAKRFARVPAPSAAPEDSAPDETAPDETAPDETAPDEIDRGAR
ncbi:MAG TPA: branched-chain amino acid ABC transporter permease [Micromonosporaceae bacterium]|nr:branched-chain amino acid ABC transporter permease [Micromonosporaceae bacterium]